MAKEIWKDVSGYEGLYQVSNLSNIKSVARTVNHAYSDKIKIKERILKPYMNSTGYLGVKLSKEGKTKSHLIHILAGIEFLDYKPSHKLVLDHKDNNKLNNNINNLHIISQRLNCYKDKIKKSSKYQGVHWNKQSKKWRSCITYNGKYIYLGYFTKEEEAAKAYENKLIELTQKEHESTKRN